MADANPKKTSAKPTRHAKSPRRMPLPDQVALVLQGGGALGGFQAGAYEALAATEIEIDWIAGISIGAINGAIIAGNPPEQRVAKLRSFWNLVTANLPSLPLQGGDRWQEMVHLFSAGFVATTGVPGFFRPRPVSPTFATPGSIDALSYYDSSPLVETLDAHVDWDLLNHGPTRLSVGAVNLESGNFRYFDTRDEPLDARHIMASGALPPGLPPVEIDGCWWWDGGLVSNTPLAYVLDRQADDLLVFQVDLFPARAPMPHTIMDVYSREKDIRYSSRTRQVTDQLLKLRKEREAIRKVLAKLPAALEDDPDVQVLRESAAERAVSVVHLIYRARAWEGGARDFEFSRASMEHHWDEGVAAVATTLQKDALIASNIIDGTTAAFDLTSEV